MSKNILVKIELVSQVLISSSYIIAANTDISKRESYTTIDAQEMIYRDTLNNVHHCVLRISCV